MSMESMRGDGKKKGAMEVQAPILNATVNTLNLDSAAMDAQMPSIEDTRKFFDLVHDTSNGYAAAFARDDFARLAGIPNEFIAHHLARLDVPQRIQEAVRIGVLTEVDGKTWSFNVGRPIVFAKVAGETIPFYRSLSGTDGKNKSEWYPFFGFAHDGWFVKSSGTISRGVNPELENIRQILNATLNWDAEEDKKIGTQNVFSHPFWQDGETGKRHMNHMVLNEAVFRTGAMDMERMFKLLDAMRQALPSADRRHIADENITLLKAWFDTSRKEDDKDLEPQTSVHESHTEEARQEPPRNKLHVETDADRAAAIAELRERNPGAFEARRKDRPGPIHRLDDAHADHAGEGRGAGHAEHGHGTPRTFGQWVGTIGGHGLLGVFEGGKYAAKLSWEFARAFMANVLGPTVKEFWNEWKGKLGFKGGGGGKSHASGHSGGHGGSSHGHY